MKKFFLFVKLWVPATFWCGLIFYFSGLPHLETHWGTWDVILRKLAHATEYGILCFLLWRAIRYSFTLADKWNNFWAGFFSFLYGISDEIHQRFVPTRHGTIYDVVIDGIGIAVVLYLLSLRGKYDNR